MGGDITVILVHFIALLIPVMLMLSTFHCLCSPPLPSSFMAGID